MADLPLPDAGLRSLTTRQLAKARQHALLIGGASGLSFVEVTEWLGAFQSQDLASAKWSLGVRVPGSIESDVDEALQRGDIVRTWPMRGTIHTVPSSDVRWMLSLTGARSLAASETRRNQLGFDRAIADHACAVLESSLRDDRMLSRPDALARLTDAGIDISGQRGYHLLWYSAVNGLTCIGPQIGNVPSVVLLDDWAPQQRDLDPADAITELVWRFYRSHGPATESDFAGWSGLPLRDIRPGIAANAGRLVAARVDKQAFIVSTDVVEAITQGITKRVPTHALPGFDEFVLGYKDRRAQLPQEHFNAVVPGGNGMFRNTICVDGQVVGTWQRAIKARHVDVGVTLFTPVTDRQRATIDRALDEWGRFVGKEVRISQVV